MTLKYGCMERKLFSINPVIVVAIVAVATWVLLVWDHYHGGVPSHHLLHSKDLPSFSNWWGALLLPMLTWFLLGRIQKRSDDGKEKNARHLVISKPIANGFAGAIIFAIVLSLFFSFGNTDVPFYMMMGLFGAALFLPIYRAECLLGFIIGMTYTFGGVLPILIGTILLLLSAALHLLVRPALLFGSKKVIDIFR